MGPMTEPLLDVQNVSKTFTMHMRGGVRIPVLSQVSLALHASECLALVGPSGVGKSSLLSMIFCNYRCDSGRIRVRDGDTWINLAQADARVVHRVRQRTIGYVSQFLRVIPRVPTLDIVGNAGRDAGLDEAESQRCAQTLLERLNIPAHLWSLPPATFSGGEQQRVNIARGLIGRHPLLLLDEPTASLDATNRDTVIELIRDAKRRGVALLGIFHDNDARLQVADRELDLSHFAAL
jgi:alpha-D-ribose 1-methylphosphonate 5-triphosphate synthase subunit PhnL